MPSPEKDPRLVSGDGPVNPRTALQHERGQGLQSQQTGQQPAQLRERMERVHARNRFGVSLQEHFLSTHTARQLPASGLQTGLGVGVACGILVAMLGGIQSSVVLTAAGLVLAACSALGWKVVHARARAPSTQGVQPAVLFDPQTLAAFDEALRQAAAELDEPCAACLLAIKEAFQRISGQPVVQDAHFTQEDRLYLRECLRRYVPDSLQAYLRVPVAQRQAPLPGNQPCARAALLQQLGLLLHEVQLREQKLGHSAAEQLLRQQRFLASKASR